MAARGASYDHAIAEGLVERIGDEIDKRVDARIGATQTAATRAARVDPGARQAYWKGVGVGAVSASLFTVVVAANDGIINPGRLLAAMIALWGVLFAAYVISRWARG